MAKKKAVPFDVSDEGDLIVQFPNGVRLEWPADTYLKEAWEEIVEQLGFQPECTDLIEDDE